MSDPSDPPLEARLSEKPADSLPAPIPDGTTRQASGPVAPPSHRSVHAL
ncbi:MAG: hypothetical protein HYY93_00395 [Planctomycetes bacterium]|nr:hypothetical protein [Planctomycetota bacterium]